MWGNKGRCPRQPYSPEATDTIAGWIKSVIQISSPTSTAKDCGLYQYLLRTGADLSILMLR